MIVDVPALGQPPLEVLPFDAVLDAATAIGHVHLELDDDSISRGTFLYQGVGSPAWPHAMLAFADRLGLLGNVVQTRTKSCAAIPPAPGLTLSHCGYVLIPFAGPPGTVPQYSAHELLEQQLPGKLLEGKLVLLGLTTAGVADWVTSPVSGRGRPISGVEYNANLLNALLDDRLIVEAPSLAAVIVSMLMAALAALLLPRLTPKGMIGLTAILLVLPGLLTMLMLAYGYIYLPLSAASVAGLLAYPFWSWRRHEIAWRFIDAEMARLTTGG